MTARRLVKPVATGLVLLAIALLAREWTLRALLAQSLSTFGRDAGRPAAETEQTERNFGTVPAGRLLRAVFSVQNSGGRRLVLRERARSCACLSGGEPEIIVPAGCSRRIELVLDTERLNGPVRKRLRYRSNDPERPTLVFALAANITGNQPQTSRKASP